MNAEEKIDCPCCAGSGESGKVFQGVAFSCQACLGTGKIKNDPFWINYYTKLFGSPDGVQLSLFTFKDGGMKYENAST